MKITVRPSVFETNSSSVHSLIVLSKDDFEAWRNSDDLYVVEEYEDGERKFKLLIKEDVENRYLESYRKCYKDDAEEYSESGFREFLEMEGIISYHDLLYSDYLEYDVNSYKSPSGDDLVICCRYGYNG